MQHYDVQQGVALLQTQKRARASRHPPKNPEIQIMRPALCPDTRAAPHLAGQAQSGEEGVQVAGTLLVAYQETSTLSGTLPEGRKADKNAVTTCVREGVYLVHQNGVENGRRRVAIYCRVSTSEQDNDRQERDLKAYAQRAGYEVVGVFRETLSGIRKAKASARGGKQPVERKKVMALAQSREINAVLVTEMTRWGRSTQDLMDTLGQLASWDVSLIAQTGLTFDLSTPQGKLIANIMASLAEFEHDLLRERVRSGIAAAKERGQTFGRRPGYRPSDRHAPEVVRLIEEEGYSQRRAAERLGISKTTVNEIIKRQRGPISNTLR